MPILADNCDETIIEEYLEKVNHYVGGLSTYYNLLDVNVVPPIPVLDPVELAHLNAGQRDAQSLILKQWTDYTQGMKKASRELVLAVHENTRATNVLQALRVNLGLPVGENPHVALMIQVLREDFNPVSIANATDKEEKLSKTRLVVGAPLHGFALHMSREFDRLGRLRGPGQGVELPERARIFMRAVHNGEEATKQCLTQLSLGLANMTWNQIVDFCRDWDLSILGRERIKKRKRNDSCFLIEGDMDSREPRAKVAKAGVKCSKCGFNHADADCYILHPEKAPDWFKKKQKAKAEKFKKWQEKKKGKATDDGQKGPAAHFKWKAKPKPKAEESASMLFDLVMAMEQEDLPADIAFMDSCASRKLLLLNDVSLFDTMEYTPQHVGMAEEGSKLTVIGVGLVGRTTALFCPNIRRNLFSLGLLESKNLGFKSLPDEPPLIITKEEKVVLEGGRSLAMPFFSLKDVLNILRNSDSVSAILQE